MSYENTSCPCGGKKPTDTMLCDECNEAFKDRPEMRYLDPQWSTESRRHDAIILVSLARKRKRVKDRQLSWA